MDKRFLFWGLCFVFGFSAAFGFDQATARATPTAATTAFSLTINTSPTLEQIGNLKGDVLGELQTAKFASVNQIETSNIVINNQLADNQIASTPTPTLVPTLTPTSTPTLTSTPTITPKPTPTLTPTSTPTPTPQSPASPAGRPSEAGTTPTVKPTTTPTSNPSATPTPIPTPTLLAYEKTIKDLSTALKTNDYQTFNSLLSSELTSTFGEDAIKQSFEEANTTYGGIIAITPISPVQQSGNWATQEVETKTQNGLISKFRIILHLENGEWKLFGTQEMP